MRRGLLTLTTIALTLAACTSSTSDSGDEPASTTTTTTPTTTLAVISADDPNGFHSVVMTDAEVGWGRNVHGLVLRTTNGGDSWADVSPGLPVSATGWYHGDTAWIAGANGLVTTTDGADTWKAMSKPGDPTFIPSRMVGTDSDRGWILAQGDGAAGTVFVEVYATNDGGGHWEVVAAPPGDAATAALQSGHNLDLAATPDGRVWVTKDHGPRMEPWLAASHDGGVTWTERVIPVDSETSCATRAPWLDGIGFGAVIVSCSDDTTWLATTGDDGEAWELMALPEPAAGMTLFEDGAIAWGSDVMVNRGPGEPWDVVWSFDVEPQTLSIPDAVHGIAVVERRLWRTADGGESWVPLG